MLIPQDDNPYMVLKEQLTKCTAASKKRKLQQLLTGKELGDHKPTQLLRRMQQLLGDHTGLTDASILQELFLQRMPHNFIVVLASTCNTTTLDNLTQMAGSVMEVATPAFAAIATHA